MTPTTRIRRRQARPRVCALLASVVMLSSAAACGSGGDDEDSVVEGVDLSGVEITVGSKQFTEQEILGQLAIEVLRAAGATVNDRTGLGSTSLARQALTAGAIDMYWEYTGTGWLILLGHPQPIPDPMKQFEAVAAEDLRRNDIAWLGPPAPADNAYALAIRGEVSDQQSEEYDEQLAGVQTLSDLSQLAQQTPEKATVCVASEFARRADGLPGLEQAYGFQFPEEGVSTLDDEGLVYEAVANGSACNFGAVFRTDSRIASLDLRLIEDDQSFFAVYNPTLTMRGDLLKENPEIEEMFAPVAAELDDETLRELNAAVDVDGQPVRDVAQDFLEAEGLLSPQTLNK